MDMQKYNVKINAVKPLKDQCTDSMLYPASIVFSVEEHCPNKKHDFAAKYYYDPYSNSLLNYKDPCANAHFEKALSTILENKSLELRVGIDACISIMQQVIDKADCFIKNSDECKADFPSMLEIIEFMNKIGFREHKIRPYFHASMTTPLGHELHINYASITRVLDAIVDYVLNDYVMESYHYKAIEKRREQHWDVKVAPDPTGNGWYVFGVSWEEDDEGEPFCEKYFSLRDLDSAVRYRIQHSKANPDHL